MQDLQAQRRTLERRLEDLRRDGKADSPEYREALSELQVVMAQQCGVNLFNPRPPEDCCG